MKFFLLLVFFFGTISTTGQRIVNKWYFKFPKSISLDTINKHFPYKIVMTLNSPLDASRETSYSGANPTPRNAKSFFKPTRSDIKTTDSLLKVRMLDAIIGSDSLLFVKNHLYDDYRWTAHDFDKYKANRTELYKSNAAQNKRRIKKSDRYYFGFIDQQNKKYVVILFDPKKIKDRKMGCIVWVDFCDPFIAELSTSKVLFAYGMLPDPE